jgi:hypothetical protein
MAEWLRAIPTQQEGRSTVTRTTPESRRRVVTYEPSRRQTSGNLNAYRGPRWLGTPRGSDSGTPYMGDRS